MWLGKSLQLAFQLSKGRHKKSPYYRIWRRRGTVIRASEPGENGLLAMLGRRDRGWVKRVMQPSREKAKYFRHSWGKKRGRAAMGAATGKRWGNR